MMSLYHPHAKDWFGTTKQFLYRFRDAQSMAKMLQTFYGGEAHQLLTQTEQEMQRARIEIMALIDRLPAADQRTVMTKRYIDLQPWKQTASEMGIEVWQVKEIHNQALPKLKRMLGLKPDFMRSPVKVSEDKLS